MTIMLKLSNVQDTFELILFEVICFSILFQHETEVITTANGSLLNSAMN